MGISLAVFSAMVPSYLLCSFSLTLILFVVNGVFSTVLVQHVHLYNGL